MQQMPSTQPEPGFRSFVLIAPAISITILLLTACSGAGHSSLPSKITNPLPDSNNHVFAQLDIDTLEDLLPRLYARFTWGPLRTQNESTALHARALTSDDRPVQITAQDRGPAGTAVQIKIGHFGDPTLEEQFFDALNVELTKTLADVQ